MKLINYSFALFVIIILEGYIVLSTELLAIRQTIPYVGSGTDTVSIIIAAVLMPLAFGYHYGGKFKPKRIFGRFFITTRTKLILNLLIAQFILLWGMSYEYIHLFFMKLQFLEIHDRTIQITLYCFLFLVLPIYALGQTVPLISRYFSKKELSRFTGNILFLSTLGSFLGAIGSTLVLMATIGVHHTVSFNFILMTTLIIILSKRLKSKAVIISVIIAITALFLNSDRVMSKYNIRLNNGHHTIKTIETIDNERWLYLNRNASSKYTDDKRKHPYIEFAEKIAITPIRGANPPRDVLVIGAGAFTFGHDDHNNNYTFVDIDKDLQYVSERYILKEPIGKNKIFKPMPARAFLNSTDQKFDVIYLDAYLGAASIPEHLVTIEFFEQVKSHMKDKAILVSNMILSPNFNNQFSRNIDNTLRAAFPYVSRHVIHDSYDLWSDEENVMRNIAYIYRHDDSIGEGSIYTDDKNTVFYDKPKSLK